jgi:hypothetical protein
VGTMGYSQMFGIDNVTSPRFTIVILSIILSHIALRLLLFFEPYLVEQERMANVQLLMYGSKHLEQNFFFYLG